MKHFILGTAGHVDHGKTALIEALTGTNTDRLAEEKKRGISIDLGFALLPLTNQYTASIVDVPGHEKYLKNMLAGTGGMDGFLLVIAADEGIMPQTIEHLTMLQLYGIHEAIVVLTKCDLVDEEWLAFMREEIKTFLQDRSLANSPLVEVSVMTGQGISELKQQIIQLAKRTDYRKTSGPFRLYIDRVFTIKGHGTVVTGSVLAGRIEVGAKLCLMPNGEEVRIRKIEYHGKDQQSVAGGQRAALNLAGVEKVALHRGQFLVTPGYGLVSQEWCGVIQWAKKIAPGTSVRLYVGTGEYDGKVYYFKGEESDFVRFRFTEVQSFILGDKAIIRLKAPQQLLGGGTILLPWHGGKRLSSSQRELLQTVKNQPDWFSIDWLEQLLVYESKPLRLEEILLKTRLMERGKLRDLLQELIKQERVIVYDERFAEINWLRKSVEKVQERLQSGPVSRHLLQRDSGLEFNQFEWLAQYGGSHKLWLSQGSDLVLPEHHEAYCEAREQILSCLNKELAEQETLEIEAQWFSPERLSGLSLAELVQGKVIIKWEDHFFSYIAVKKVIDQLQDYFSNHETLKAAEFRDLIHSTRKTAIPLLEYLDQQKITIRKGNDRYRGPKITKG